VKIELTVNGTRSEPSVEPGETLLDTLRGLGYVSVKDGCANGDCGTCAVLLGERAVAACLIFSGQADGAEITTIEGFASGEGQLHPLQQTMLDTGGVQCGYCIPGMILTAADLLQREPEASREEVATYLAGNLCRCTGYTKQLEAIDLAAEMLRGESQ
jgi:carbon-monoxide dehydrogenase small subunit